MNETLDQDFTTISHCFDAAKRLRALVIQTRHHAVAVFRQTQETERREQTLYSSAAQRVNTSHRPVQTLHSNTTTDGSKLATVWEHHWDDLMPCCDYFHIKLYITWAPSFFLVYVHSGTNNNNKKKAK